MKLKTTEKGFTLIELLVALTIGAAIVGVMAAAVITILRTTSENDELNVNMRQVQNAGRWITRDTLMAKGVSTNTTGVFLNLSWSDWNSSNNTIQYVLNGTTHTLTRSLNGGAATLIAQNIVSNNTTCTWDNNQQKLTVRIRASLHGGARYAEGTYEISPRPY